MERAETLGLAVPRGACCPPLGPGRCSPQNDEFAILDGPPWLCIFTGRREHSRALVPRVLEV